MLNKALTRNCYLRCSKDRCVSNISHDVKKEGRIFIMVKLFCCIDVTSIRSDSKERVPVTRDNRVMDI